MINNKKKLKEYINKYPDQVYVNQNNLFENINYETQELGYAGLKVMVDNMIQSKLQHNQHKEYIRDYMKIQYNYANELEIDPSDEVYKLAQKIYQIATDNHDICTVYSVFLEFIDDIDFENKLLNKIGNNIMDKEFISYIHDDDTQIVGGRVVPQY